MGVVFEAVGPGDRRVAVKLVLAGNLDPTALARFKREAELLAEVEHPNIVRVHDLGQAPEGPYLVTELIDGDPPQGPLPPEEAVAITAQIAEAAQALHDVGLIHRDLKPSNVLIRPDGSAVLLDFGLARELAGERLTHSGDLIGSPAYTPPEQAEGKRVGPRADVYGLGALLYQLLTGRAPFEGPHALAVLTKVMREAPTPPSHIQPGLPRHLEQVCLRAMAKTPADRYASALELAQALRAADDEAQRLNPALILLALFAVGSLVATAWWTTRPTPATRDAAAPTAAPTAAPAPPATPTPTPTPTREAPTAAPWQTVIGKGRPSWVWARFLSDTFLVVTTSRKLVETWDVDTGRRALFATLKEAPKDVAIDPAGRYALVAGNRLVRRIEATRVSQIAGMGAVAASAEFPRLVTLPGDRFVLCKQGRMTAWTLTAWNRARFTADLGIHKAEKYVGALAYVPHRRVLVTGTAEFPPGQSGRELRAHDPRSGKILTDPPWRWVTLKSRPGLQAGGSVSLAVDAERDQLASGSYLSGKVQLFDLSATRYVTMEGPSQGMVRFHVRRVVFDPRGRLYMLWGAPGHHAGVLQRWDPAARRITWRRELTRGPTDLDISPDGRKIAIAFYRASVEVFSAPP